MAQALGPTRRGLIRGLAAGACSLAAQPLFTRVTLASAPGQARLVVIVLRGGMDGLDVVRPVGDAEFTRLRPGLAAGDGLDLDGFFALHPALSRLMPLWRAGELGFAHATSTPYRDRRSHFDGQDVLEAGTAGAVPLPAGQDGWLNRLLRETPGSRAETAWAVGDTPMPVLSGPAEVMRWSPDARLALSPQARLLLERLYAGDPLFAGAAADALSISDRLAAEGAMATPERNADSPAALAGFVAARMREEARIAAFSLAGWDTHRGQARALPRALGRLQEAVLALRAGLGPEWGQTLVLAMTEFGRTAAENGSGGTDHGTGGAMLLAGGALRGGRVVGRWPGLAEAALLDRRDLLPTADIRGHAAWAIRGLFGVERAALEARVFPGLDMGDDPGIVR